MRRAKPIEDVMKDPRGLFHVGQLIGAADMVAHFCAMAEDEKTQRMGKRLADAVGWFFVGGTPPGEEVGGWTPDDSTR